jgi:hypothetical protein
VFLTKTRALLNLGDANRDVGHALDQYKNGTLELPPGCSVTYELEAIEMLRPITVWWRLSRPVPEDLWDEQGCRQAEYGRLSTPWPPPPRRRGREDTRSLPGRGNPALSGISGATQAYRMGRTGPGWGTWMMGPWPQLPGNGSP